MYYLRTRAAADAIKFTVDQQALAKNRVKAAAAAAATAAAAALEPPAVLKARPMSMHKHALTSALAGRAAVGVPMLRSGHFARGWSRVVVGASALLAMCSAYRLTLRAARCVHLHTARLCPRRATDNSCAFRRTTARGCRRRSQQSRRPRRPRLRTWRRSGDWRPWCAPWKTRTSASPAGPSRPGPTRRLAGWQPRGWCGIVRL